MIKVKAKRTFFTVDIDDNIKQFVYDSHWKPSNRELLNYALSITGGDTIKIVSRETYEIVLTMSFETFYEFSDLSIEPNNIRLTKHRKGEKA